MSVARSVTIALFFLAVAAPTARADGFIIPFAGVNFAGNSGHELSDAIDAKRFDWGATFAYMGAGVVGLEGDIGYSPDFFGKTDVGGSSVLTATGNLLLGVPIGGQHGAGVRPYVLIGLGVVRARVDALGGASDLDTSKAAWDFGGGVMFFIATHVGVRGDLRYFRSFGDVAFLSPQPTSLDFARASAGVILRF